jgi:hypothetical protein
MPSLLGPTTFCSRCARPWYSTQFKSCVDCRRGASLRGFRARQLVAAVGNGNLSTEQTPSPNSLTVPVFSTLFFSCSTCARPCHSSYDTTTCYRCRHADSSTASGTVRALLPAGPLPEPCFQPSRISQPSLIAPQKRPNPTPFRLTVKRQRTLSQGTFQDSLDRALSFLRDELEGRAVASDTFPPEISCSIHFDFTDIFSQPCSSNHHTLYHTVLCNLICI